MLPVINGSLPMCLEQASVQQVNNEWEAEGDSLNPMRKNNPQLWLQKKCSCLYEKWMYMLVSSRQGALTLMLELSMLSKSSAEMVGTLLTRSIRKRPTLLSAATLPDWDRSNSITFKASISVELDYFTNDLQRHNGLIQSGIAGTWPGKQKLEVFIILYIRTQWNDHIWFESHHSIPTLTSTSSMYASTVVSMSCTLAAEPPTWDRSEVSPLVRLGVTRVLCRRSTATNRWEC